MIRDISIKNLALIESLSLSFSTGFSVFTGETGAGKSILIGAIGLLLGERASTEMVRNGSCQAEITGVFTINKKDVQLSQTLIGTSIPFDNNELIIRRIIQSNGRNKIFCNQIQIPLATLKEIGNYLIDLHGQHDHQSLFKPEHHAAIINSLDNVNEIWTKYGITFADFQKEKNELENCKKYARELLEKKEFISFQYSELNDIGLKYDEENILEEQYRIMSSSAERIEAVSSILSSFNSSDTNISLDKIHESLRKQLVILNKFDPVAEQWQIDLENILPFFSELRQFCEKYRGKLSSNNSQKLDAINSRLAKIQRLKKKHQCTMNELIDKKDALASQLSQIDNGNSDISHLTKKVMQSKESCIRIAKTLSKMRKESAFIFDKQITLRMQELGFNDGEWRTNFKAEEDLTQHGLESTIFEVRTNSGEPFLPLHKTASGGEISRLMLAVKSVLAQKDMIPVLIFDEIDSGVGGHLAKAVAKELSLLSQTHQVLCITHLHQIASRAQNHFFVSKHKKDSRTITTVVQLNKNDRIEEIARMLGDNSDTAIKHAKKLVGENEV